MADKSVDETNEPKAPTALKFKPDDAVVVEVLKGYHYLGGTVDKDGRPTNVKPTKKKVGESFKTTWAKIEPLMRNGPRGKYGVRKG